MTLNSHSRNMSLQQSQIESPGSRRWWSRFRWYISCFSIYILIWDRMHSFEQCIFRNTKHTLQKTRWEYHSCPSQWFFSCFLFLLPLIFLFILLGGDTLIFREPQNSWHLHEERGGMQWVTIITEWKLCVKLTFSLAVSTRASYK